MRLARKRVLVVCGTGIATSTVVTQKIAAKLREQGIEADLIQCKVTEVPGYAEGADLIVATTPVADSRGVPVIQAIALLTGIGEQEVLDRIVQALSS